MTDRISRKQLMTIIQEFEAVSAVGSSAVRGQPSRTADACRDFLKKVNLMKVPRRSAALFSRWLNHETQRLQRKLPNPNRPWGIARKALNLFLRSCFYNRFLCERYRLDRIASWLEVPLDSVVAKKLKEHAGRGILPKWLGLGGLTPEDSEAFQRHSLEYAAEKGLPARVFLDNYLWLLGR